MQSHFNDNKKASVKRFTSTRSYLEILKREQLSMIDKSPVEKNDDSMEADSQLKEVRNRLQKLRKNIMKESKLSGYRFPSSLRNYKDQSSNNNNILGNYVWHDRFKPDEENNYKSSKSVINDLSSLEFTTRNRHKIISFNTEGKKVTKRIALSPLKVGMGGRITKHYKQNLYKNVATPYYEHCNLCNEKNKLYLDRINGSHRGIPKHMLIDWEKVVKDDL